MLRTLPNLVEVTSDGLPLPDTPCECPSLNMTGIRVRYCGFLKGSRRFETGPSRVGADSGPGDGNRPDASRFGELNNVRTLASGGKPAVYLSVGLLLLQNRDDTITDLFV